MSVEVEFQRALVTKLKGSMAFLGLQGVYDIRPQAGDSGDNASYPCAVIGDIYPVENDTQTRVGFQVTHRIHIYSRSGSMAECKTIQGKIFGLLHRQPLTIAGFKHINYFREDTICDMGLDGTAHGVCEYFGLVETE